MSLAVYSFQFPAMGSHSNEVRLSAEDAAQAQGLAQLVIAEVQRIEKKYSRYLPSSVAMQINQQAILDWVVCDEETQSLIAYGDALFRASDGLFDLTSGTLRRVWNFQDAVVPTTERLNECLSSVGWQRLERDGEKVRFSHANMELDFGGIGKEYAADRACALLQNAEVAHGFVNLAGDIAIIGPQLDGRPWSIAVPAPRTEATIASIPVALGGMATSGDYERFFEKSGKRYCHILNPRTGYPARYWQSVTVLAPTASIAGSCSTIAMLMEADGLDFLKSTGFAYLAIDQNSTLHQFS
jgi:FAD:protein FMN transferase